MYNNLDIINTEFLSQHSSKCVILIRTCFSLLQNNQETLVEFFKLFFNGLYNPINTITDLLFHLYERIISYKNIYEMPLKNNDSRKTVLYKKVFLKLINHVHICWHNTHSKNVQIKNTYYEFSLFLHIITFDKNELCMFLNILLESEYSLYVACDRIVNILLINDGNIKLNALINSIKVMVNNNYLVNNLEYNLNNLNIILKPSNSDTFVFTMEQTLENNTTFYICYHLETKQKLLCFSIRNRELAKNIAINDGLKTNSIYNKMKYIVEYNSSIFVFYQYPNGMNLSKFVYNYNMDLNEQ